MASYKLTIRRGPKVSRERFEKRADAVAALEQAAESVVAEGGLGAVQMFRSYEPGDRVAARLEITKSGLMGNTAGVDVMGDGRLVPFTGSMMRQPIEPRESESPFDTVRRVL